MPRKIGKVENFRRNLTQCFVDKFGSDFHFREEDRLTAFKEYSWGRGGVSFSNTGKGFPSTRVQLCYGVIHDCLVPIFEKIDIARGYKPFNWLQFYYDTLNKPLKNGVRRAFVEDYNYPDNEQIISELIDNSTAEILEYFEKFSELTEIRKSLEDKSNDFFQNGSATDIFVIDYYLSDWDHLKNFLYFQADEYQYVQIEKLLDLFEVKLK